MRLGIKGKQIAGVTAIVAVAVTALSALHVAQLAQVVLRESHARGELLSNAIFHRAREVVPGSLEPYTALGADPGLRAILESAIYGETETGAFILDTEGVVVAASDATLVALPREEGADLTELLEQGPVRQLGALYSQEGQTLEVRQPMMLGDEAFGSIRIGISTLLMRQQLNAALGPALWTAALALGVAVLVAALLAQALLRPIHVIRSGLTRLGQGELGVTLDLPPGDEFGELGAFFNSVSQRLSADRDAQADPVVPPQSSLDDLADAVALFDPSGDLLFRNPSMQATFAADAVGRPLGALLPAGHPYRAIVEETLATGTSQGPIRASVGFDVSLTAHAIAASDRALMGVLLVSRNVARLSQVQSTIASSRKLVALGRLTAGVAHEVKNPLNAMIIHLELLRTKIRDGARAAEPDPEPAAASGAVIGLADTGRELAPAVQGALRHVELMEGEIRRLDEVVQGFLKFTRPEELRPEPVNLKELLEEALPVIESEAHANAVKVEVDIPASVPDVSGDAAMLRQVALNLAINACQAMPDGGTLRLVCAAASQDRVEIRVEDTGVGIKPEDLEKIFDLYYSTKDDGTGIGLSMVYRIVQMHEGEVEVQSTLGRGTVFRVLLPRVSRL
ncbi:MAG: ATP-binding protein [Acidobacteria bacterium]|nr:ATP-binding protein [Acidobacteriota bacterium]